VLHQEVNADYPLKHLIVYPVSNDRLVNFILCTKDLSKNGTLFDGPIASTCPKEELLDQLPGWEAEVQALVKVSNRPYSIAYSSSSSVLNVISSPPIR